MTAIGARARRLLRSMLCVSVTSIVVCRRVIVCRFGAIQDVPEHVWADEKGYRIRGTVAWNENIVMWRRVRVNVASARAYRVPSCHCEHGDCMILNRLRLMKIVAKMWRCGTELSEQAVKGSTRLEGCRKRQGLLPARMKLKINSPVLSATMLLVLSGNRQTQFSPLHLLHLELQCPVYCPTRPAAVLLSGWICSPVA